MDAGENQSRNKRPLDQQALVHRPWIKMKIDGKRHQTHLFSMVDAYCFHITMYSLDSLVKRWIVRSRCPPVAHQVSSLSESFTGSRRSTGASPLSSENTIRKSCMQKYVSSINVLYIWYVICINISIQYCKFFVKECQIPPVLHNARLMSFVERFLKGVVQNWMTAENGSKPLRSQPAASPLEKRSQEAYELPAPVPASNRQALRLWDWIDLVIWLASIGLRWTFGCFPGGQWMRVHWANQPIHHGNWAIAMARIAAWDPAIWFGQHSTCGGWSDLPNLPVKSGNHAL